MSFCVLYKFIMHSGADEKVFVDTARRMTNLLRLHYSSLGSRLHATGEKDVFIGYAEWPSEAVWKSLVLRPEDVLLQTDLGAMCRSIEILNTMTLVNAGLSADQPKNM